MIIWINFVTNPETELMCFKFSLLGPLSSAIGYLYCLHFFSQKNNPPKWGWDFYIILIKNGVFALTESWKTKEKRRTFYFIWNIFTSQLQSVQENIGNFLVPCVSFTWKIHLASLEEEEISYNITKNWLIFEEFTVQPFELRFWLRIIFCWFSIYDFQSIGS